MGGIPYESHEFAGQFEEMKQRIGAQGRRRSGVPARLTGAEISNWDDITLPGFYWGEDAANAPFAGKVMAEVMGDGTRLVIEARDPANLLTRSARRVFDGSSWAGWLMDDRRPGFLIGVNKGKTTVPHNSWTFLNTANSEGTNARNDGFTYGLGRILVPRPGIYDVDVSVRFGQTASGEARLLRMFADEAPETYGNEWHRVASWAAQQQVITLSGRLPLAGWFKVQAYQNSGANMDVVIDNISAEWRGA